ncbi:hypothetical protein LPJ72_000221 [Coemansia sp. Benny D160-2]|nr:hypothetical protein LPJ72_000221 [Coemansia sp. Benny D160-2]
MQYTTIATIGALAACASATPTRHNNGLAAGVVPIAPIALANPQTGEVATTPLAANYGAAIAASAAAAASARADRDARREERRKEWQEWAHQQGANGVPNGTTFVSQILDGVSGIVDSALGPVYSLFGTK